MDTLCIERNAKGSWPPERNHFMSEQNLPLEDDYTPDLLTLEDEDGKEHTFEVIDAADFKDARYMAVVPYVEDPEQLVEEDMDLIIMRVNEDEEGEYLDVVDDDDELFEVSGMFAQRLKDLYDIEG